MGQYYIAGPNPMAAYWRDRGCCEVFPDGTYIYHSNWPLRSETSPVGFGSRSLAEVVANDEWVSVIPQRLLLPAGV